MTSKRSLFKIISVLACFCFLIIGGSMLAGCNDNNETPTTEYSIQKNGAYTLDRLYVKSQESGEYELSSVNIYAYMKFDESTIQFGTRIGNTWHEPQLQYERTDNTIKISFSLEDTIMTSILTIENDYTMSTIFDEDKFIFYWHEDEISEFPNNDYKERYAMIGSATYCDNGTIWKIKNDGTISWTKDDITKTATYEIYGNMAIIKDSVNNEIYYGKIDCDDTELVTFTGKFINTNNTEPDIQNCIFVLQIIYSGN